MTKEEIESIRKRSENWVQINQALELMEHDIPKLCNALEVAYLEIEGWKQRHQLDIKISKSIKSKKERYQKALEQVFEIAKIDGIARELDRCYCIAREALDIR